MQQILKTSPDHDGLSGLDFELGPCSPSVYHFARQGSHLKVGFSVPDKPAMEMYFPADLCEGLGRGGICRWHRKRCKQSYPRELLRRKAKPGRILGIVLQESATPKLTHTLFPDERGREEHVNYMMKFTKDSPSHAPGALRIDAFELRTTGPDLTLEYQQAAHNTAGPDLFLQGSLRLAPDDGGIPL